MFFEAMHPSWQELLRDQIEVLHLIEQDLTKALEITPEKRLVMRAFELPVDQVRVLFFGQDPYPTRGVATGLAFEVQSEKKPQSLKNLMLELVADVKPSSSEGNLARWQAQGVMLLNAALTTEIGKPGSHDNLWRTFIETAIERLDGARKGKLVIVAMGNFAKRLASSTNQAVVIESVHPSPLSASRGFFGSKIFSRTNEALVSLELEPIDWSC